MGHIFGDGLFLRRAWKMVEESGKEDGRKKEGSVSYQFRPYTLPKGRNQLFLALGPGKPSQGKKS